MPADKGQLDGIRQELRRPAVQKYSRSAYGRGRQLGMMRLAVSISCLL